MSGDREGRSLALSAEHLRRLGAGLESGFTRPELARLLLRGLDGEVSVRLDAILPRDDLTLHQTCAAVVEWALHDRRVGLEGLLAAAVRANPHNPELGALQREWAGVRFRPPVCPYPGMRPYTVGFGYFYGRDDEVARARARLARWSRLAIVGPSGCGKSSLLAAALLPGLAGEAGEEGESLRVVSMRPGPAPYAGLEALLGAQGVAVGEGLAGEAEREAGRGEQVAPAAGVRLVVVVDQYEEVFTVAAGEERRQFERALCRLMAMPRASLILAVRADFYGELIASQLGPFLAEHTLPVAPLRGAALREAIERPARDAGVLIEPALVERLLAEAGDEEPGVLPFLQETLRRLWYRAEGFSITLATYRGLIGGRTGEAAGQLPLRSPLQVALAEHAEEIYTEQLASDAARAVARRVLLRLVQFGEGRPDTRREQAVEELREGSSDGEQFDRVLGVLTAGRLLTLTDKRFGARDGKSTRYADLAHEALIRGWPRFAGWIEQRRSAELTRRRLEARADERQRLREAGEAGETGGLLDAVQLAEAEAWAAGADAAELGVSPALAALIRDSRQAVDRAAEARAAAARRLRRRNQALAVALGAALVAVVVAAGFFLNAQREAQRARQAEAVAQQNLDLAQQQLAELAVEQLLARAYGKRAALDAPGALADLDAAAEAAAARSRPLDVRAEISATLRYVATQFVWEGERILCTAGRRQVAWCEAVNLEQGAEAPLGTGPVARAVPIAPVYLEWARGTAPQLRGWDGYTTTVQQAAVISATALFSQALALAPPPSTPVYVWVAPGVFTMGSTDQQCTDAAIGRCPPAEQPAHTVTLGGYWLLRTEVLNEQYRRCVAARVCTPPNNNYWDKAQFQLLPVTDVTFDQAATYAAFTGGRLPTEAEWEMGCRGGDGRIYPWPEVETAAGKLNFGNSFGRTTEAGTYPPGTHGLYDMAGNVWEWTADWFDAGYYAAAPAADPQGPAAPGVLGTRTLRGGSWRNDLSLVRCAYRDDDPPGSAYYNVGLRTVAPGGVRGWLAVTQVRRSGWSLRSAAPYVAVPPAPIDAR